MIGQRFRTDVFLMVATILLFGTLPCPLWAQDVRKTREEAASACESKVRDIEAGMRRWASQGHPPVSIRDMMHAEFFPLVKAGKYLEAERVADRALELLKSGPSIQPPRDVGKFRRVTSETQYLILPVREVGHLYGGQTEPLDRAVQEKIEELGQARNPRKRNWGFHLIIPAWKFDPQHSVNRNADIASAVHGAFDVALRHDIAVHFTVESHDWSNRDDLWNYGDKDKPGYDPANQANVEWSDWSGTPHPHRYRDWGSAESMPPVICYNSPVVLKEVSRLIRSVVAPPIKEGLEKLKAEGKEHLFSGVTVGAEPALPNYEHIDRQNPRIARLMDRDGSPKTRLGYNALSNLGYSKDRPPEDFGRALAQINRDYTTFWSKTLAESGIPTGKMYTHVAAGAGVIGSPQIEFTNAPIEIAFNAYSRPGWTTYPIGPLRNDFSVLYQELARHDNPHWASTEAAPSMGPPGTSTGLSMKDYLSRHFDFGATVMVFNTGATSTELTKSLTEGVWGEEAIEAYRSFLAYEPPAGARPNAPDPALGHSLIRSTQRKEDSPDDLRVRLASWRERDDVVEGWDWSLPPGITPVKRSGLIFPRNERRLFPGNKLADIAVFWRDVEPEEGRFDFESVRRQIEDLPKNITGCRLHFYASVAHRTRKGKRERIGPIWLDEYQIPVIDMTSMEGRFHLFNFAIWDDRYHKRYLRVIRELGRSGIPKLERLRIVYVGAISKSWGEELYIPRDVGTWCEQNAGLTPEKLERCLIERLDAWASAFQGVERKLAWVGAGNDGGGGKLDYRGMGARVMQHAYEAGMGQRCGFVENYLYQLANPWLGQSVNDGGYQIVDETCPPIAENRAFGDENEEYGPYWTGRFGPLETHAYRYHESMIRALQMRRNYLWMSSASVDMDPALTAYVSLALGRRREDSPDAFCYLRESTVRASAAGKQGRTAPVRNFERWLMQRDRVGYHTRPALRVNQHEMMWMVPQEYKFDWIARRTDIASGNRRIGLDLDDRFLSGGPHSIAVKVTYHDRGHGRWTLVYDRPNETSGSRSIVCKNSGKVLTATFFLTDACFTAKDNEFDFYLEAEKEDVAVSLVRVIKNRGPVVIDSNEDAL